MIAGTIELLRTGATRRFAPDVPVLDGPSTRVRDSDLRALHQGKLDWPHMTPAERRQFLDNLNEAPRGASEPA